MRVVDGRVEVEDSVSVARPIGGEVLRVAYLENLRSLSLGLLQVEDGSIRLGSLELLRLGPAEVSTTEVAWPIEGGLLVGSAGGSFRIRAAAGRVESSLNDYRPALPLPLYMVTQLPIHHLLMRLHLLRVRGRRPAAGVPSEPARRLAAGAIDVALCASLAALAGRGRRLPALVGITAGYHVACWSLSGRTLGGLVMRQRVVAVDGSRLSVGQSAVRLLALPVAAFRLRAVHDDFASSDVIKI